MGSPPLIAAIACPALPVLPFKTRFARLLPVITAFVLAVARVCHRTTALRAATPARLPFPACVHAPALTVIPNMPPGCIDWF
jgi:hypothetical protein